MLKWPPPRATWVKIKIDGASKGNPVVAVTGRVLRSSNGNQIGAFAEHLGYHSLVFAEAKVILLGLRFAKSIDLSLIWVETNPLLLVNNLNCLVDVSYSIAYVIRETKKIAAEFGDCKFTHIHRECNGVAASMENWRASKRTS